MKYLNYPTACTVSPGWHQYSIFDLTNVENDPIKFCHDHKNKLKNIMNNPTIN